MEAVLSFIEKLFIDKVSSWCKFKLTIQLKENSLCSIIFLTLQFWENIRRKLNFIFQNIIHKISNVTFGPSCPFCDLLIILIKLQIIRSKAALWKSLVLHETLPRRKCVLLIHFAEISNLKHEILGRS